MVTALDELGDIDFACRSSDAGAISSTKPVHRLELTTASGRCSRIRHLTNERDRLLAYIEEVDSEAVKSMGLK